MNIDFDLVNVKYQIKYPDGVLCKQRSDQANVLGEIISNNVGEYFNRKKEVEKPNNTIHGSGT